MKNLLLAVYLLSASTAVLANTSYSSDVKGCRVNGKSDSEVLEVYTNILNSCSKNDIGIDACLSKFKAQSSEPKYYCCRNVSGSWGEYAYIHGQDYCIPPC